MKPRFFTIVVHFLSLNHKLEVCIYMIFDTDDMFWLQVCRQTWKDCKSFTEEKNDIFKCGKYYPVHEVGASCLIGKLTIMIQYKVIKRSTFGVWVYLKTLFYYNHYVLSRGVRFGTKFSLFAHQASPPNYHIEELSICMADGFCGIKRCVLATTVVRFFEWCRIGPTDDKFDACAHEWNWHSNRLRITHHAIRKLANRTVTHA